MSAIRWRSSLRYGLRHPWLLGLSILGVALGVAVVLSIDLANSSARAAFLRSTEEVTGAATHHIVGGTESMPESVYTHLRLDRRLRPSAPVVEGYGTLAGGQPLQVLGIDPLADAPFRGFTGPGSAAIDLSALITLPNAFLAEARALASWQPRSGMAARDTLTLRVEGRAFPMVWVGGWEAPADGQASSVANLMVVDLATAQEVLGLAGRLSRIDLILADEDTAAVRAILPSGTRLVRSSSRTATITDMTRAFEVNLTALSLLALLVGMFLIYNTMTFAVVQRRGLIGRMRVLGVTRREVFTMVLAEAAMVGFVGTVLGLLLGVLLGKGLVQLVARSINDLYFVLSVTSVTLSASSLGKAMGLGVGTALVAALAPAHEATRSEVTTVLQRSRVETDLRQKLPWALAWGGGLAVGGGGLLSVPGNSIILSYTSLFFLLLGCALLAPAILYATARLIRPLLGRMFGMLGRMAAGGLAGTLSRTGVAAAALMVAIASTVGVGVMVDSFRVTVASWLSYALQADLYIQPPNLVVRMGTATVDPRVVDRVRQTPGVQALYAVRERKVSASHGPTTLLAITPGPMTPSTFRLKAGDPDAVWKAFESPETALISEPYAFRYGLGVGDRFTLATDEGPMEVAVRGIYFDYASDLGSVLISRAIYEQQFKDRGYSGLAIYVDPDFEADAVRSALLAETSSIQEVFIRSNRELRQYSLSIFDRTFTVTAVLRLLALLVAFMGVLTALMALQLERQREFALLRAQGMTPAQVGRYVTLQTALMGLVAGLMALPVGLTMAYVLIFVINKRSFGWTLQVAVEPVVLVQAVLVALVAALLAGLYPAWVMARTNPALALRQEASA